MNRAGAGTPPEGGDRSGPTGTQQTGLVILTIAFAMYVLFRLAS